MIGAWCFVDHYGPLSGEVNGEAGMSIAAHPHTGLQTVTWLLEGKVEHRDSIGSVQEINPGELNLMTAGRGIAHSEMSLVDSTASSVMHGVQLWIALPESARQMTPTFEHHGDLPRFTIQGAEIRLLMGEFEGHRSRAAVFSPLIGAEISLPAGATIDIPTRPDFEYGLLILEGDDASVNGETVAGRSLRYLATGGSSISLASNRGARVLLIGGEPFPEEILMWWNFIARSHEEIIALREQWQASLPAGSEIYPAFIDSLGARIPAPEMPNIRLEPRGPKR
jgi:redox-sensitive bicupin YhaK (pirin superfamily)